MPSGGGYEVRAQPLYRERDRNSCRGWVYSINVRGVFSSSFPTLARFMVLIVFGSRS